VLCHNIKPLIKINVTVLAVKCVNLALQNTPPMRYIPNKPLLIIFCITSLLLAACHQQEKPISKKTKAQKNWDRSIEGSFSTQVALKLDSTQVDTFFQISSGP